MRVWIHRDTHLLLGKGTVSGTVALAVCYRVEPACVPSRYMKPVCVWVYVFDLQQDKTESSLSLLQKMSMISQTVTLPHHGKLLANQKGEVIAKIRGRGLGQRHYFVVLKLFFLYCGGS